jgi:uncharacterized membrane protein YeaQ/YmgE (transglycosylase-associated protein family)
VRGEPGTQYDQWGLGMTVDLTTTTTKVVFWILVVLCGVVGGFAADLVKTHKIGGQDQEGVVERPTYLSQRYLELGVFASLIVGAVAAAVAVWILGTVQTGTTGTGTAAKTVDQYLVVKLVGTSLLVGFSGPKFLQTAAEKVLAQVNAVHLETGVRAAAAASAASAQSPALTRAVPEAQAAVEHHASVVGAILKETLEPGSMTGQTVTPPAQA